MNSDPGTNASADRDRRAARDLWRKLQERGGSGLEPVEALAKMDAGMRAAALATARVSNNKKQKERKKGRKEGR